MAKGYDDASLPVKTTTVDTKWIVYAVVAISVIVLAILVIPLLPKSLDDRVSALYDDAQNYVDNGNLLQAKLTYSKIISLKPNEEKAWHEKGKILVRTNSCDEAIQHYEQYVIMFPQSSRGAEGYELAKLCR